LIVGCQVAQQRDGGLQCICSRVHAKPFAG
jgi:hypothetical protein